MNERQLVLFLKKYRLLSEIARRIGMNKSSFLKKTKKLEGQRLLEKDIKRANAAVSSFITDMINDSKKK